MTEGDLVVVETAVAEADEVAQEVRLLDHSLALWYQFSTEVRQCCISVC